MPMPSRHYVRSNQLGTKDAISSATIGKSSFKGYMKKTTALVAIGASAMSISRLPPGAIPSPNRGSGCWFCHRSATADRNYIPWLIEVAKAELLPRCGWDAKLTKRLGDSMNSFARRLEQLPLPRIIKEPPPLLLLLGSSATLAFAITYLRHTHRTDRYQDKIIAGSVAAVTVVGLMSDNSPVDTMTLIPWAVMLGLVLSPLVHAGIDSCWSYGRKEQSAWLEDKERTDTFKHTL